MTTHDTEVTITLGAASAVFLSHDPLSLLAPRGKVPRKPPKGALSFHLWGIEVCLEDHPTLYILWEVALEHLLTEI